jgi:phenylpropionate dioxygenase-like ring-hydroxylating dioxygenase large terminal subunit
LHHEFRLHESTSGATTLTPPSSNTIPYNWENHWYAVTFANYIPNPSKSAEVTPASIFGNSLVLWRSKDNGIVHCADDVCPHRSAALSEGRVRDGKLECYYHGWQYDGNNNGKCNSIPQLEKKAQIPKQACLKMRGCRVVEGIVWVWMGEEAPLTDPPMQGDGLEEMDPITGKHKDYTINDFQIDLPYDHSYLIENLLDPAHIPISHDRTPGGGKRENAQAYEMLLDANSMNSSGFTGRYRTAEQRAKDGPFIEVTYEAPGIIRQTGMPRGKDSPFRFGAALHCMPLTMGRSRLLFRTYFTGKCVQFYAKTLFILIFRNIGLCLFFPSILLCFRPIPLAQIYDHH